jgi:hypothetical protein
VRHLRMLAVAVGTAVALGAVAATGASALPEFGQCYHKGAKGGKYTKANCVAKAKKNAAGEYLGEYEWKKVSEIAVEKRFFTAKGGVGILFIYFNGEEEKVECTSESATGEITGTKTIGKVLVKFFGCQIFGLKCSNTGVEGEVQVRPINGTLGWINKSVSPRQVGISLQPTVKKGLFASFDCSGIHINVGEGPKGETVYPEPGGGDSIISPIVPVNEMSPTFTQVFSAKAGKNQPEKLEGKALDVLEAEIQISGNKSKWEAAGQEIENVTTGVEPAEIKAN